MADFIAKTLSHVHIGSGQTLIKNLDFTTGKRKIDDKNWENAIGILDLNKISSIIGIGNIEKLIDFIEGNRQRNIIDFIRDTSSKKVSLEQVSKRLMWVDGDFEKNNFLKEQLHNSDRMPFIPGSSIKGAIRTAIISYLVNQNSSLVKGIIHREMNNKPLPELKLVDFQKLETKIVNKLLSGTESTDANRNLMRFLIVGDAVFEYETIAEVMEILNFSNGKWDIKQGQSILLEMIPKDCESEPFRININQKHLEENLKKEETNLNTSFLKDIGTLAKIVNDHTKKLLDNELNFWQNQTLYVDNDKVDSYVTELNEIKKEFSNLQPNEMILRVGGNEGWAFITGGWAREFFSEQEWDKLYHMLNKGRNVSFFPKTRKITEFGEPMGFIKITSKT